MLSFCNHYTAIDGNVSLVGGTLTDTAALSCLTAVTGDLSALGTSLQSINLPSLSYIGGVLSLRSNLDLTEISIPSLFVVDSLEVSLNHRLFSVDLGNLIEVPGFVSLFYNPSLIDAGLDQLTTVGAYLTLYHNFQLTDLSGIGPLTSVGGDLYITFSGDLPHVILPQLASIGGNLELGHGPHVTEIQFAALTSVGGSLLIRFEDQLTFLSMPQLGSVGGDFTISDNGLLPTSQAESLRDQVIAANGIQGSIRIEYNQ